jgi:predicted nucleic acid-binding protein
VIAARKIVVDTGILADHLSGSRHPSDFRRALSKYFCYVTVFQAAELFAMAGSAMERRAVIDVLAPVKLLGLNARSAQRLGRLLQESRGVGEFAAGTAVLCADSRLPLLTQRPDVFRRFPGVRCIGASDIR